MLKEYSLKKVDDTEFGYIDQDGVSYESPANWLWTNILGGCGCGSADKLAEKAVKVLELFATDHMERKWDIYDDEAAEVIAHWMNTKGLTEHGTSIAGSWLSELGNQIYKIISPPKKSTV